MAQEPLYPHIGVHEQSDMPRAFRVAPDRTIVMISTSYRGYNGRATPVYDEIFAEMIGRTADRGAVALDAMFKTFNPPYILHRRVMGAAVKATGTGFRVTTQASVDGTLTVKLGAVSVPVAVLATDTPAAVAGKIANAINNTQAAAVIASHAADSDAVGLAAKVAGVAGNSVTYQAVLSVVVPTTTLTLDADLVADNVVKATVNGVDVTVPFTTDHATTLAAVATALDAATPDVASAVATAGARTVVLTAAPGVATLTLALQDAETQYVTGGASQAAGVVTTGTATVATAPAGLAMTPVLATSLTGGVDGPKQAKVQIPTSDPEVFWTVVWNFPGSNGNDGAINVLAPSSSRALFTLQLIDTFANNKVTNFTNLTPDASRFVNEASSYGMRYLGVNHPLVSVYYNGDLTEPILAPVPPVGSALPVAPPVLPSVHYSMAGGDDGPAPAVNDFLREIRASRTDRARVVFCPNDDFLAVDKRAVNAALAEQATQSIPLTGCRQAITQLPYGDTLADNLAALNDNLGRVVGSTTRHTCTFRNDQAPNSYTGDMFIAAAMTTKKLWLSLADRDAVKAVSVISADFNGNDEFSLDVDILNQIWETGHEAIIWDPGTKAFQFLTGRALHTDMGSEWSRANNRQLEDQFRMDIYFMLQRYKSSPLREKFQMLISGLDRYLKYWRDDAKAVQSIQGTVGDASNNPPDRLQEGFARVDCHWAPLLIMDNIDVVIHTYLDTTLV